MADIPIETYRGVQIYTLGSYTTPYYFCKLDRIGSQYRSIKQTKKWIDKYKERHSGMGVTESKRTLTMQKLAEQVITRRLNEGKSRKAAPPYKHPGRSKAPEFTYRVGRNGSITTSIPVFNTHQILSGDYSGAGAKRGKSNEKELVQQLAYTDAILDIADSIEGDYSRPQQVRNVYAACRKNPKFKKLSDKQLRSIVDDVLP